MGDRGLGDCLWRFHDIMRDTRLLKAVQSDTSKRANISCKLNSLRRCFLRAMAFICFQNADNIIRSMIKTIYPHAMLFPLLDSK